jgi:two-component system nitrate/nitrite response regulator NarL
MSGARVLVVDDHPIVRRGLVALLDGEAWVAGVWEAADAEEAVRTAVLEEVDVVAMDVGLPGGDGIEATRRILRSRPTAGVLMLTMSDDDRTVERALAAGARGYLLKETDPDTVVDALRTVASGGVVLGPRIGPAVLAARRPGPAAPFDRLTVREQEVLRRLAAGRANSVIARELGLSDKTVRNYLSSLFTKLGVVDRVQAAFLAREAGFVADDG